jgi:oxepin-CoA hydrolase / 3-oxo-5,6-dehydrosuberyl-CoA semialdehyde dehydrogenase
MQLGRKEYFLSIPEKLRQLSPEAKPLWGLMSPQHMVEHVIGTWRISNGRARVTKIFHPELLEKRRNFLFSEDEYERNIPNPVFGNGLQDHRKESLSASIDQLESEIQAFFQYHEENPMVMENHPVFGALDTEGWILFQKKHMSHHLAQFGI